MNILTFDIEEWFHILDHKSTKYESNWDNFEYRLDSNMERIFDLLNKKNQKATFFCLGWVARKFPHIIKKIDSMNYEIASHSDMHQLAYQQNRKEFKEDLKKSIDSIESITGKKVKAYRAPGFSLKEENKWVFEELLSQGIEIDCSIFPAKRAHGGFRNYGHAKPNLIDINGLLIKEFPINLFFIVNIPIIFSGGGYFRLFPYQMIKHMMKKSNYVMTYFHPRDFDNSQPVIKDLSTFRKFKSYYGIHNAFEKLEKLISDFDFVDLNEANKKIDLNNINKIVL